MTYLLAVAVVAAFYYAAPLLAWYWYVAVGFVVLVAGAVFERVAR